MCVFVCVVCAAFAIFSQLNSRIGIGPKDADPLSRGAVDWRIGGAPCLIHIRTPSANRLRMALPWQHIIL